MKCCAYVLLSLLTAGFFIACSNDLEPIDPSLPPSEQITPLENGNVLITYPNGVTLEKTATGEYIWQGDILLSDEQRETITNSAPTRAVINNNIMKKWPGGVIFYEWGSNMTYSKKELIKSAMKQWEEKCPIMFVEYTPGENQKCLVDITIGRGNLSNVGMTGTEQTLQIDQGGSIHDALHLLGHSIGLFNEHCRKDRDNYIILNTTNIKPEKRQEYAKISYDVDDALTKGEFDFFSVMLDPSNVGSDIAIDTSIPIWTKKSNGSTFPSNKTLSNLDIQLVNNVYGVRNNYVTARPECSLSGTVEGEGYYYDGQRCTLRAIPADYRKFDGWYDKQFILSKDNVFTFSIMGNHDLIAKFITTNNTYNLDISTPIVYWMENNWLMSDSEPGSVSPSSMSVALGREITIVATPKKGFAFVEFFDLDSNQTLSTSSTCSISMNRDYKIEARFKKGNGLFPIP